jgi:hypothetical protein
MMNIPVVLGGSLRIENPDPKSTEPTETSAYSVEDCIGLCRLFHRAGVRPQNQWLRMH